MTIINENLRHRGVRFAISRVGPEADASFGWIIYPSAAGYELPAASGIEVGPRAFGRAYAAAGAAIDDWLALHIEAGMDG